MTGLVPRADIIRVSERQLGSTMHIHRQNASGNHCGTFDVTKKLRQVFLNGAV